MKQCPACNRTYTDDELLFCLEDGTQLQGTAATAETLITSDEGSDPNRTIAFTTARDTNPPPTNVYEPAPPAVIPLSQTPPPPAPSWRQTAPPPQHVPTPSIQPAHRSNGGRGWIIGGIVAVLALGAGIVVLLAVIGRDNSSSANSNTTPQASGQTPPTTSNGSRTVLPPVTSSLRDDFSRENWPTGAGAYGSFYQDGEYHMKGQPNLYVYMFARNRASYSSKDADVKVTARSVDGKASAHGYGLVIHGKVTGQNNLEGYGFLIYTGTPSKFGIVRFVEGMPRDEVEWTQSSVIRGGTNPNQIQVLTLGPQLSFYINGQFVKSITDTAGYTEGFVGLYSTEANEVAFDDLEIKSSK
ncbi:MAG TPA: hypothetical protein VF791_21420 [Pyrinomonadaceae bacterium]